MIDWCYWWGELGYVIAYFIGVLIGTRFGFLWGRDKERKRNVKRRLNYEQKNNLTEGDDED